LAAKIYLLPFGAVELVELKKEKIDGLFIFDIG
jgi:hypothetical protein